MGPGADATHTQVDPHLKLALERSPYFAPDPATADLVFVPVLMIVGGVLMIVGGQPATTPCRPHGVPSAVPPPPLVRCSQG